MEKKEGRGDDDDDDNDDNDDGHHWWIGRSAPYNLSGWALRRDQVLYARIT